MDLPPISSPNETNKLRQGGSARLRWLGEGATSRFTHVLVGTTVSAFGSQMTNLVLPLMAVQTLAATSRQMAFLQAAGTAPYLLFGLFVGHWLGGQSLRRIMIAADLARTMIILLVAVTIALGFRNIEFLIVAAFIAATFSLLFDSAYYSFVPTLVEREGMLRANSRLETSRQGASVTGTALAGLIFQTIGPPLALCIDSLTYLLSALSLSRIPADDVAPDTERVRLRQSLARGVRYVAKNPLLISLTILGGSWNFFWNAFTALYVLFLARILMLSATYISLVIAAQSVGLVAGAWVGPRLVAKVKIGSCIGYGSLLAGGACLVVGLLSAGSLVVPLLAACAFVSALASSQSGIAQLSIRQSVVPKAELTLVNTTVRFVFWGMLPLGALTAGAVANWIDLRHGMIFAAVGLVISAGFGLLSPVGRLKELPQGRG